MSKNKQKYPKKILVLTGLILSLGVVLAAMVLLHLPSKQKPSKNIATQASTPTYTAESEGEKIQVPTNIDPNQIKNYELITENEQYKIRKLDGTYTITLYAIINRPDQASMYRDQLKEFKHNALEYLKSKNIDIEKVNIVYEPNEATNL